MAEQVSIIFLLLAIATAVTALAIKYNRPYPIALVLVGAAIGFYNIPALSELKHFVVNDKFFRTAVIMIFLPALLGEASFKLPVNNIRENRRPILLLAVAGTLISFAVVGLLESKIMGLVPVVAFVFAALMSATDPVSVLSIFKSLGVDRRLELIMEGESLANDGVAVVLFSITSSALFPILLSGGFSGIGLGIYQFIKVTAGGAAVGSVLGIAFSRLTRLYDNYPLEIMFSAILFYGSFIVSEQLHLSGVIAVVTSGIILGNYGKRIGMTPTTALNINTFWDVVAFFANSLVFLMVGLEIARIDLAGKLYLVLPSILIVLLGRGAAVYLSLIFAPEIPSRWKHAFNWGGLRGSLSIALALSLPFDFPQRETVILLTFGVVMFSLAVQGISIGPFVKALGLSRVEEELEEYENAISAILRAEAGITELNRLKTDGMVSPDIYNRLSRELKNESKKARLTLHSLYQAHPELEEKQYKDALKKTLYAEYAAVEILHTARVIGGKTAARQQKDIIEKITKE